MTIQSDEIGSLRRQLAITKLNELVLALIQVIRSLEESYITTELGINDRSITVLEVAFTCRKIRGDQSQSVKFDSSEAIQWLLGIVRSPDFRKLLAGRHQISHQGITDFDETETTIDWLSTAPLGTDDHQKFEAAVHLFEDVKNRPGVITSLSTFYVKTQIRLTF